MGRNGKGHAAIAASVPSQKNATIVACPALRQCAQSLLPETGAAVWLPSIGLLLPALLVHGFDSAPCRRSPGRQRRLLPGRSRTIRQCARTDDVPPPSDALRRYRSEERRVGK